MIEALLAVVQNSQVESEVRSNAAFTLGRLRSDSPAATQALLAFLQADQVESEIRSSAAFGLGRLGSDSPAVMEALLSVVQNNQVESEVRGSAAAALKQLDKVELALTVFDAVAGIGRLFQETQSWNIRRYLAQILGLSNPRNESDFAILWQGLLDKDNAVRHACARSLAQIGKKQPLLCPVIEKKLIESLHNPNFEVRDNVEGLPAYDYAYEALWLLITGNNQSYIHFLI